MSGDTTVHVTEESAKDIIDLIAMLFKKGQELKKGRKAEIIDKNTGEVTTGYIDKINGENIELKILDPETKALSIKTAKAIDCKAIPVWDDIKIGDTVSFKENQNSLCRIGIVKGVEVGSFEKGILPYVEFKPFNSNETIRLSGKDLLKLEKLQKNQKIDLRDVSFPVAGLSLKEITNAKALNSLLKGHRTDVLENVVTFKNGTVLRNTQGDLIRSSGRLQLYPANNKIKCYVDYKNQSLQIPSKIMGKELSLKQLEALKNGAVLSINNLKKKSGEKINALIAIDKELNKMHVVNKEHFKIGRKIAGFDLSDKEREDILSGKTVEKKNNRNETISIKIDVSKKKISVESYKMKMPEVTVHSRAEVKNKEIIEKPKTGAKIRR